jgi:hypothetical protein
VSSARGAGKGGREGMAEETEKGGGTRPERTEEGLARAQELSPRLEEAPPSEQERDRLKEGKREKDKGPLDRAKDAIRKPQ